MMHIGAFEYDRMIVHIDDITYESCYAFCQTKTFPSSSEITEQWTHKKLKHWLKLLELWDFKAETLRNLMGLGTLVKSKGK